MDKKIEELVEWVASVIGEDYYDYMSWEDYPEQAKNIFRTLARKALAHPDLALIDREKQFNDNPYFAEKYKVSSGYLPVIPLAEALKEVNND